MITIICGDSDSGTVIAEDILLICRSWGFFDNLKYRRQAENSILLLGKKVYFTRSANLFFGLIVDINEFFVFQTLFICYKRLID